LLIHFFAFHCKVKIGFPYMKGNFCASSTYKRQVHPTAEAKGL